MAGDSESFKGKENLGVDASGTPVELEPAAAFVIFGERIDLARAYVASLASEGVLRGLIGPREAGRLWSRHVLNSAVVGSLLSAGCRVVDIGSGAGLPGIPLAISRPDCQFDLVEPLERRATYLREIVETLELGNCQVIRGRADEVVVQCGEADIVTSRAVAPLAKLAAWSAPLLRTGGKLMALKGSSAGDEIQRDQAAVSATGLVNLVVVSAGGGLVDPVTSIIKGTKISMTGRPRRQKGKAASTETPGLRPRK